VMSLSRATESLPVGNKLEFEESILGVSSIL
jgi:hypothetical protein